MNDILVECFKEASETLNFTIAANNLRLAEILLYLKRSWALNFSGEANKTVYV